MPKVGILTAVLAVLASGAVAYPLHQALLAAMQNYYVQEMLTALLLFSAGFSVVAVVILIIFLLDQGLSSALVWFGHCTVHAAQRLHRGWVQASRPARPNSCNEDCVIVCRSHRT